MYKLTREQKTFIKNDKQNKKLWDEAMESLSLGPVSITVYLVTSLCLEEFECDISILKDKYVQYVRHWTRKRCPKDDFNW